MGQAVGDAERDAEKLPFGCPSPASIRRHLTPPPLMPGHMHCHRSALAACSACKIDGGIRSHNYVPEP